MTDILRADYLNPTHAQAILTLMQVYAKDPMGGGTPLSDDVAEALVERLAAFPTAFAVLAFVEGQPAGLANCFEGFSTFAAKPLINVHDLIVAPAFRGQGIARALFAEIEVIARERHACKVTLEVLEGNATARRLYEALGFGDYVLDPAMGRALFWQKML
ncbi:GNAT family N-acetyltransferase [Asticcacaulis excentricus]|uniref:GCN5-related N-acetyltransferase n=1 Tax=Asticcacaulis excentricus (strain ATCC 15261 / DSM 4724 / KCTC 12464 / NCIMB 9791 / VKM B-1370 / CB 48) TaxID=573065 RepID=E8RPE0_ASTEC|nr:GNAT family N-acetyltransferase [Asticcacaulis excentricus]ADU11986.1 GCN5-related N-acetyltransferase [Asticcacaulis excentricus CB 48]